MDNFRKIEGKGRIKYTWFWFQEKLLKMIQKVVIIRELISFMMIDVLLRQ